MTESHRVTLYGEAEVLTFFAGGYEFHMTLTRNPEELIRRLEELAVEICGQLEEDGW